MIGFQVVTEQERAKRVAAQAAAQAAYKSSNVQNERASKELHDIYIAQESARSVPASFSANQLGSQQVVSIPNCQSGFIPYSSAVLNATVLPEGQQGNSLRNTRSMFILHQDFVVQRGHSILQKLISILTLQLWPLNFFVSRRAERPVSINEPIWQYRAFTSALSGNVVARNKSDGSKYYRSNG